jgi:hypothetical protein
MGMGDLQVVEDGAGEQHGLLRYHAEVVAQFVGGEVLDVGPVDLDVAVGGLVEALQ